MKKKNARKMNKKQIVRKVLSVFITSALLVCQLLLTTGQLTATKAWAAPGIPEYSDFGETLPEEGTAGDFSDDGIYPTAEKVSEDGLFDEAAADESVAGETAAGAMLQDAAPTEEMNAEAAAAGVYPADESTVGETAGGAYPAAERTAEEAAAAGAYPTDETAERTAEEAAAGGYTVDDTAVEENAPDEYTLDDTAVEENAPDGTAVEENAPDGYTVDGTAVEENAPDDSAGDDTAVEEVPDQYTVDDTAADEYSADDTSEDQDIADGIVPDDIAAGETLYEDNVTDDDSSEDILSEESSAAAQASVYEFPDEDGEPEYVFPLEIGAPNIDNDQLFAGYVCRELEVDEDFLQDISDPEAGINADYDSEVVSSPAMNSNYAGTRLEGYSKTLYDCLLNEIRRTAAGERTSTQFQVTAASLGLDQTWWSAADLGVDAVTAVNTLGNTYIKDAAKRQHRNKIGIDFNAVIRALVSDCPYDMYWYDKTVGTQVPSWFNKFEYAEIDGEMKIRVLPDSIYIVKMPVSSDYALSGTSGTFVVNPDIGTTVATVRENTRAIVDRYSDCTDYQKLDAYRKEICDSNSYNYAAINDNAPYGNPWQLLYAFDGDDSTKIVCEGYSKAFQYLCDLSTFNDIFKECISVTGMLGDPGSLHMWNIVSLQDGTNYLVDLTNCDTGMVGYLYGGGKGLFMVGTGSSDYLNYFATGNVDEGYKFNLYNKGPLYRYDDFSLSRFGKDILTLSEGKVLLQDTKITVEVPPGGIGYDGTEKKPGVTVKYKNWTFTEGSDYTVEYSNNIDVGNNTAQALVKALGGGHLLESAQKTFSIVKGEQKLTASDLDIALQRQAVISVGGAEGELSFTSSDSSIVQVDEKDGSVTGLGEGTAIVTVNAAETDKYNAAQIAIKVRVRIPIIAASGTVVSVSDENLVYDGSEKTPEVTIVHGNGNTLVEGTDYTLAYSNNVNAGTDTGLITITGQGRYIGSITEQFTIQKAPQSFSAEASASSVAIGKNISINVTGAKGEITYYSSDPAVAEVSSDGKITGKKTGTAEITVASSETDNYLSALKRIKIDVIAEAESFFVIDVASEKLVYDGSEKKPAVSVSDRNGNKLVNGTDYTLAYSNNINAGTDTGIVKITGKGVYTGTVTEHFTIEKAPQSLSVRAHASSVAIGKGTLTYVTGAKGKVTYSSSNPTVAGVSSGGIVTGKKIGKAVITVVSAETGNYLKASQRINISIVPAATSSFRSCNEQQGIKLTWKKVEGATGYDIFRGSARIKTIQGGSVESYLDKDALTNGTRYSYKIYARASTGVSTLYRSAAYCRLTRPSIVSLYNPAPGKMLVTWAKNTKATKYQVQYSQYSDFRSSATVNVMGASTLKTVIGGLSRNHIRYVRIRTCKTVGNVTYTSMWSSARKLMISK